MAKKKKNIKITDAPVANPALKRGMVFEKENNIYDKQMILSNKIMATTGGLYRECVAWNNERCARYDTTESELSNSKYITSIDDDELARYIKKNKSGEWTNPDAPSIAW